MLAAACTPLPPAQPVHEEVPLAGGESGMCDASRAQSLVGREASSDLGAEALRMSGASAIRWIVPGSAVTMDYREDRLNIELNSRNAVAGLRCG